eukprot:TRINITY_DN31477_c0_g1_i1.p1 TRINITY_DN31477_c0_g1~~TRINITY_DN31477_c0_g1_i1.p1  ORF type:complete len:385 (-),score=20.73 TRINITY_DN31477_c0_g1_i1:110-1264(-)
MKLWLTPFFVLRCLSKDLCLNGIARDDGTGYTFCCSKQCGTCSQNDCNELPGGPNHCCRWGIKHRCWSAEGPPPCVYSSDRRSRFAPVRGPWKCWVEHFGVYQSWGDRFFGPGARLDEIACSSSNEQFFDGVYTRKRCCRTPAVLPQRCDGEVNSSIRSPCASLDQLGKWFAVGPATPISGADKHSNYHKFYDIYQTRLARFSPSSRLLEIGVRAGNSLAVWGTWFHRGSVLGVELDLQLFDAHWPVLEVLGGNRSGNVRAIEANGLEPSEWLQGQQFDIIVDDAGCTGDGKHSLDLSIGLFKALFPAALAPGGLYIIEDAWDMPQLTKAFSELIEENVQLPAIHTGLDDGERADQWRRKSSQWKDQIVGVEFRRNLIFIEKFQ